MKIEMSNFSFQKRDKEPIIGGFRLKKYNDIYVGIHEVDGKIDFKYMVHVDDKELLEKWLINEKSVYEQYINDYLNTLDNLESQTTFKGEILKEKKVKSQNGDVLYNVTIQFEHIPGTVRFSFFPAENRYEIIAFSFAPRNHKVIIDYDQIVLNTMVSSETIKRMWDPFRNKTKFKLELLHMIR